MNDKRKDTRLIEFSIIIRKRRINLGYNNAELFANEHKINRSVYQRWENGKDLNLSSLLRLLEMLDMKGSDFFELWEDRCVEMPAMNMELTLVAEKKLKYNK